MTQQNNLTRGINPNVSRIFQKMATERAQAEEMEIKEMDPDGDMVIATGRGPVITNAEPEDSLYFGSEEEKARQKEAYAKMKAWAESGEKWDQSEDTEDEKPSGGINSVFFQKPGTKKTTKFADAIFDGVKGILQTLSGMNSGEVMRTQQTVDELNFMEKALQIEEQFKEIDKQLNDAYLARDTKRVRELYPHKKTLFEVYDAILPDLNRAKRKYWNEVTTHDDKYSAISNYRNEILENNKTDLEDMEMWNNAQNYLDQNVHHISEEWEKGKEGEYGILYQLPNALGTSASSLAVSIGTSVGAGLLSAGANAMAASPALSSGVAGAYAVGGAALIGFGTSVAGTLWARNQESLSEVSNNYTQTIQEYAQKHEIDTSDIIKAGRKILQEKTGSYSDDPNNPEYRDDSQVITGMLSYGIEFGDLELDKATKISRRKLEDVYNRNMMLATSDVAQNIVMLPGVGKFLNKAASIGVDDATSKLATKTIDGIMKYTSAKIARATGESVAKRSSKYIVDPIVRIGFTGLSEGFEETSQYMFGKQLDPDNIDNMPNRSAANFYSPLDIAAAGVESAGMLFKGIQGLMGISSDEALNNDEELATNFKVGALVGMLMGGVSQFNQSRKNFNAYNKGLDLARNIVKDQVNAREAMFRYNQYAEKALGGVLEWDAFNEGFDAAINSEQLPDSWSREDLEHEKNAAKSIFAMAQKGVVKDLPKEHQAVALAYLQYQQDRFKETQLSNVENNTKFNKTLNDAVLEYCQLHGIDEINAPLIAEYFRLRDGKEALKKYEDSWLWLRGQKDYIVDKKHSESKLIDLANMRDQMDQALQVTEMQLKNAGLYDLISKHNELIGATDEIASNTVANALQQIALDDIRMDVRNILNSKTALLRAVVKYKQSIKDNEQLEERARQVEDENTEEAIRQQNNEEQQIVEEYEGTGLSTMDLPDEVLANIAEDVQRTEGSIVESQSIIEEQPKTAAELLEVSEQSYYEQLDKEDIQDYDTTDYTEQLSEEALDNDPTAVAEQFEEHVLDETRRIKSEVEQLRSENEALKQRLNELDERVRQMAQGEPHRIVEHPDQPSAEPTPEEIAIDETAQTTGLVEPTVEGDVTLFYDSQNSTPMMPGYESSEALNEYLSTPGAIKDSQYFAFVGDKNSPYGTYDPNDRTTWGNAAVYVEILGADGKKYITALKTIQGAKENALRNGKEFTPEQEANLRNTRNTIIEAKLANPDAEIYFDEVRMSAGKLNNQRDSEGRAVQRKLTEIKGLHLPADLHELLDPAHGIRFGIGKGIRGKNIIVDQNDNVLPGQGGSGAIYIYPAQSSTIDGVSRPIQLTSKKFIHNPGDTNSFAYNIAKALVYGQTQIDGIPLQDLLQVALNYGEGTLIDPSEQHLQFLTEKQFNVNYQTGEVTLGENKYSLEELRNNDGIEKIASFIATNLHWNTEKNIMWNKLPASFKQYLKRTGKDKASLFNGEIEFDQEDLTLSGIAYLIKHGYLTSDLGDQIYTSPFVYVSKPRIFIPKSYTVVSEPSGTDSSAMDALLMAEQEEYGNTSVEGDPYVNPSSSEMSDFFGDLDGAMKTISTHQVGKSTKKINEKQARKWLSNKLGLTEDQVEVVDGVIRTLSNGRSVIGVAKEDSIKLSREADHGVQYHEAWHRVSLLMLTPEQRQRLYKEFKKSNPRYRHASDKVVEEALADQFMDYMIADDKEGFKYFVNKWFRKIKHFVGINANIDHYSLQEMFKAVKYGELAKYKLDKESLQQFRQAYKNGANYTIGPNKDVNLASIKSPYEYQQLLNSIQSILIASNGIKYISQIQNLDPNRAKQFIINMMNSPKRTTAQREVLSEVINNFDVIMQDLRPILEKMGIREIDAQQDEDFNTREDNGIQNYDKAAYEFNKKDNALGSAKIFLSTIPDTYYSYEGGIRSNPIPRVSTVTGLPLIVDYDTAYAKVLRYLSDVETFAPTKADEDPNLSIIGKCRMLGEFDPFFAMLHKRLVNVDMNTATQLLQTIKSFNQNFQEINYQTEKDGSTSFYLSDSINRRAIKNKPIQWSENFFNSRFIDHSGGVTKVDTPALTKITERFNVLHDLILGNAKSIDDQKFNDYLNTLIKLFNELGVTVDREVFDLMLGSNNRYGALVSLVDNRGIGSVYNFFNIQLDAIAKNKPFKGADGTMKQRQLNQVFTMRGEKGIINALANFDVQAHPSENEISVLGPNNNVIFTKTLNNFVSDQVRWLNTHDPLVMADFQNDPYCKSSLIYNTVLENGKIKLNTFVNFYGLNKNDKGRDYVSISPVEDYIAKMVFTWNNHIIFPTMADKKTWYTISGCKLFNEPFLIERGSDGKIRMEFDVNALDHVYNEWLDEYNTIVEYHNTLPNVTKPIKNYHTAGKGGLFRHHTGYFTKIDGQLKWVDLNARLKNSDDIKRTLEEIKQELFTDKQATYQKINDNLSKERQSEIERCIKMGIIESKNGRLVNKLLDSSVLKHFTDLYKQNGDAQIASLAEHFAIVTMIGNHMLNTNISVEETEKMFTGDVAFFKNNDDKIKRLGAVLSTGDNLRTQWMQSKASADEKVNAEHTRLQNRQTYTSTVINDNMVQSQQYDLLKEMFTQYYIRQLLVEQGLTEAEVDKLTDEQIKKEHSSVYKMAKTLAEDDASAYGLDSRGKGAINQADAAVYISPQMYRDIVQMLGEWNDEIAEAYDIMESGLDWLSDRTKCAKAMKALIKPLKTTYFCNQYNESIKHTVPVFDKMAMFPLFKVIATGDNKEIYDRMNAIGKYEGQQKIDQVAFESAKKVGIIGATDVYTDHTNEKMNDLSKMHVVTQRFRNLRRQLITDPHAHDRTLFGTQVSTVAVSNLILDRVYQEGTPNEKTGQQIMEQLFGTINAISNNGIKQVTSVYLTTDGELDLAKTSMELVKKAHSQNMGKDVEDALQLNETKDDFKIPLAALPDSKWVETALISDVNRKAVDLELPGGAFIQMSSFGVKSINVVTQSKNDYIVNNGKRLVNMNPDGSMDAVISINLLKHIIPGYEKMSFMEARQWLIDNEIIGENAQPAALGYRIPTQGLSSIAGMRISDVLPSVVGDTIILPDEFTAQTGSDFDIDKLYIARYNYETVEQDLTEDFESWYRSQIVLMAPDERGKQQYINRFGNRETAVAEFLKENKAKQKGDRIIKKVVRIVPFDHSLGYEGNSREANENLLLRTYLDVLTDKKNVGETRLPLDKTTGIIKDEILPIVDGPKKKQDLIPYKELSPSYQMDKKYEYNGGKAGIGPFALNNKNHILTQLMGLRFSEDPILQLLGFNGLDGINSRDEMVIERDEKGRKIKNEDGTFKRKLDKGVRILDWLSAMINAHVDVAKDPYVIRLNVCQYTYNLCNFLLRAGYGKSTFYFLPQPILKEMSAAYDNASGNYGVDATKSKTAVVNEAIQNIRNEYASKFMQAAKNLGKTDIEITVDKYGVSFKRAVPTKDENGQDKIVMRDISWQHYAKKLMDRDFLIDQLQLNQQEEMSDQEAYDYYFNQLMLSELFLNLNDKAQDMSKLVQLSQIDTKKYGNNFVEQDRFVYRLKALLMNTTLFNTDDLLKYYQNTFLYTKLINGIITPQAIFEDTMLRSKRPFLDSITRALMLTIGLEHNDEALNKTISNEFEAYIRNQFLSGKVDIHSMFYGDNSMPKRLAKLKADILTGKYPEYRTQDGRIANGLLNHLDILSKLPSDAYDAPAIITRIAAAQEDKNLNNHLKEYWAELLNSSYPEIKQFAQDLVTYMLLTTGGNHTKNGIFHLTPIEYIMESGYGEFMRQQVSNFVSSDIDFDAFFLNNWHNDKLVKPIKLTKPVYDQFGRSEKDRFPIIRFEGEKGQQIPVIINPFIASRNQNASKDPVFQPFIKVRQGYDNNPANTLVYKLIGYNVADRTPIYALTNKLGLNRNGRIVKEYHGSTAQSEFDFNNHPFANIDLFGNLSGYKMTDNNRKMLGELLKNIIPIVDYMPVTQALNIQFNPNIERAATQPKIVENNEPVAPVNVDETIIEEVEQAYETVITEPIIEEVETVEAKDATYTFPNGLTIDTGFVLNDQQRHALDVLSDFVTNPDKYQGRITLAGYAGTGKTTMIKFLHKFIESQGLLPVYSAPTHRANAVTQQNNPNAIVLTLHSFFGLRPTIDLTKDTLDLKNLQTELSGKQSDLLSTNTILIIDESSMIDDSLYDLIEMFKNQLGGIIFMGDSAQLSPVQNEDGKISKVFTYGDSNLQLTKVERTGDNPILEECTNLRNGKPFNYATKIIDGEGVTYVTAQNPTSNAEVLNTINTVLNSDQFADNPLHFRILCGTNQLVGEMNRAARTALFGNADLPIQTGELLMGYKNQKVGRNGSINNSFDYMVVNAEPETQMSVQTMFGNVSYKGQFITIKSLFDDGAAPITVKVVSLSNPDSVYDQLAEINKRYAAEVRSLYAQKDKRKQADSLYSEWKSFQNSILTLQDWYEGKNMTLQKAFDFGYAHTIHKSQGGTYDSVMILDNSIENTAFDDLTKQQLRYVAMSRAKHNVWVVTKHAVEKQSTSEQSVQQNNPSEFTDNSSGVSGTINVYSSDNNGYQSLSNFSIRPFTLKQKNGTTVSFQSVEQAFQFSKAMYFANNPSVATKIMFSTNSAEIKQLGTTVPMTAEQIQKWNQFSTGLMHRLMLQSFMQNESAKQSLLSTGDVKITHQRNGVEQDNGRFSKLLEQVRNEIRQMEEESRLIEEQKQEHDNKCNR